MVKKIPLTKGQFALVDDEDFDELSKFKWCCANVGYAIRFRNIEGKRKSIYMHRFLLSALPKQEVDHINHNKLDNRRSNIRLATSRQNKFNTKLRANNKSGFKGVSWVKRRRKWGVQVKIAVGKTKWVGYFDNKKEAHVAYCSAARELYGEFACV